MRFNLTPVVRTLLIINVAVFLLEQLLGEVMIQYLSLFDFRSVFFMPHQFITYMFMHSPNDFFHILFNMLWLVFMGPLIERFIGDKKFLILYMVCGVGAGLLQISINYFEVPDDTYRLINVPLVGASGAVAGVMLAAAMLFPNSEIILFPIPIPIKLKYFALFYIAFELYNGIKHSNSGVAHFAHLGGMLFAFILLKIWQQKRSDFY